MTYNYNPFRPKKLWQLPKEIQHKIMSYHPMVNSFHVHSRSHGSFIIYFEKKGVLIYDKYNKSFSFIKKMNYDMIKKFLWKLKGNYYCKPNPHIKPNKLFSLNVKEEKLIKCPNILNFYPHLKPIKYDRRLRYDLKWKSFRFEHYVSYNEIDLIEEFKSKKVLKKYIQIIKKRLTQKLQSKYKMGFSNIDLFDDNYLRTKYYDGVISNMDLSFNDLIHKVPTFDQWEKKMFN